MTAAINIETRFHALTSLLGRQEDLWRPVPFYRPELPWESNNPALAAALRNLDELQLQELESDSAALLTWLTQFVPEMGGVAALAQVPLQPTGNYHYSSRFHRDIPGRKWQQIEAFAGCMGQPNGRVLEWCAGKA